MEWFTDWHVFLLSLAAYGLSTIYSVLLWRKNFRQDDLLNYLILFVAFGLQTASMWLRGVRLNHCPVSNLYEATTFISWTLAATCLAVAAWPRLRFLGAFASPVLFAISVFAVMLPGSRTGAVGVNTNEPEIWTSLHAASLSLAYGAFGLSSVAAAMYLTQEHNLKFRKLHAILAVMPSIERLETIVGRLLLSGFALLTVGLALGAFGLLQLKDSQSYGGDPKVLWSGLVWLIYLGLVIMRWKFAQGGRRFALGAIGTFAFVLLTFWGINLLSPLHNH